MKIGIIDDRGASGGVDPPDPPDPGGGGDFPSILSVTGTHDTSAPYNANMPATVNAGDLLILISVNTSFGEAGGDPTGWTFLGDHPNFGSNINVYYKRAVGTEDSSSVQVHTSGGDMLFAVIRLKDVHVSQAPEISLDRESNTNSPDTPSIDPSWATSNNLIIAVVLADDLSSVLGYPPGYNLYHYALNISGFLILVAAKEVAVSTGQDPGAFGLSSSLDCYLATLAVRGL